MSDKHITKEQLEDLVLENIPSKQEQQSMVDQIEVMVEKGINPEQALQQVFSNNGNTKH